MENHGLSTLNLRKAERWWFHTALAIVATAITTGIIAIADLAGGIDYEFTRDGAAHR